MTSDSIFAASTTNQVRYDAFRKSKLALIPEIGGVANEIDPLSDVQVCKRDVAKFQKLGINAIRVYSVDNSKAASHDDCMKLLADAGIYVAIDVNRGTYSLNNEYLEATKQSYNDVYLQSVFSTVDAFAKYDNLLLFFSGNEVINNNKTTFVAPYVKAVTRDVRQYIKSMNYRQIPVGYAATDVEENRWQMAQYMNCGADDVRSDFFAFNDYSWCAPSSYQKSGWDKKVEMYRSYDLPILYVFPNLSLVMFLLAATLTSRIVFPNTDVKKVMAAILRKFEPYIPQTSRPSTQAVSSMSTLDREYPIWRHMALWISTARVPKNFQVLICYEKLS